MSRKNLLAKISGEPELTAVNSEPPRPAPQNFAKGAFGAVTRGIDDLAARARAAGELEAKLIAGQTVIDLDPEIVEDSVFRDRIARDDEDFAALVNAIAERGQDSPILVRPHPAAPGRYQVAFGHRRLRAARRLARPVRAVVKALSDRDLALAQGQENSARANLSFIERALFAYGLEAAGQDRETIMSALGVDKTVVSRMVSVAARVPHEVIQAIGAAPSAGRDRWVELAELLAREGAEPVWRAALDSAEFAASPPDARFDILHARLARAAAAPRKPRPAKARYWATAEGKRLVRVESTPRNLTLAIDQRAAPGFGEFVLAQMDALYESYSQLREEAPAKTAR
jgi:ParB family chromosome partitioning protein